MFFDFLGIVTQRPMVTGARGNFPLSPSGPIYTGSGATRVAIVNGAIGNLGRDTQRAPGAVYLNMAVSRKFQLREGVNLQFRVDAFNALNHTNLGMPSTALTVATSNNCVIFNSPGFGAITSAGGARVLQIVARINF